MPRPRRRLRGALVAVLAAAAVALTTPAAPPADPYAAPATPAPLGSTGLTDRYEAVRGDIAAARATADRVHDTGMTAALDAFLTPGRNFLSFDARGSGRVVEVLGDLATADRIAVLVPGADGRIGNFDSRKWAGGGARALAEQARSAAPGTRLAVVAWLGYASPASLGPAILTSGRAVGGAPALEALVADLHRVTPGAAIALLCHSYGSVVCAEAADGIDAADIVLYGSPGTGFDDAAEMRTPARVWAGRGSGDWIQLLPHARLFGIGFGTDPVSPGFGAHVFEAGSAAHSDYLKPGSTALANLTLIALGKTADVTRG
jgi:hypothetical protein